MFLCLVMMVGISVWLVMLIVVWFMLRIGLIVSSSLMFLSGRFRVDSVSVSMMIVLVVLVVVVEFMIEMIMISRYCMKFSLMLKNCVMKIVVMVG